MPLGEGQTHRWDTGPMSIVQSWHSPALGQPGKYPTTGPVGVNLTPRNELNELNDQGTLHFFYFFLHVLHLTRGR